MELLEFDAHRTTIDTDAGTIGYADFEGEGPAALFVHGVFMNGLLWRNVIEGVRGDRRLIALDLPGHGRTKATPDTGLTLPALAEFVVTFLDAIGVDRVDLVGNDTGGAVCQHVAVGHPERIRSLALTNCDTPGNFPPEAFKPTIELVRSGSLPQLAEQLLGDIDAARGALGTGYEHPERLPEDVVRAFLEPVLGSPEGIEAMVRFMTEFRDDEMDMIEPQLKGLDVPTLLVWGTADQFFPPEWAHRLRETLPDVRDLVEVPGGKLFFVDERANELVPHLRRFWKEQG